MDYDNYFPEGVYTPKADAGKEQEFSVLYPESALLSASPAEVRGMGKPKAQIRVWIDRSPVLLTQVDGYGYWHVENPYELAAGEHEICVRSMYAGVCLEAWVLFRLEYHAAAVGAELGQPLKLEASPKCGEEMPVEPEETREDNGISETEDDDEIVPEEPEGAVEREVTPAEPEEEIDEPENVHVETEKIE